MLVFQGEKDEFGSMKQVEGILNRVACAKSIILPAVGHNPHKEAPDEVLSHSTSFIRQLFKQ